MVTKKKRQGRDKLEDWDWHIRTSIYKILLVELLVKDLPANAGDLRDTGLIPG